MAKKLINRLTRNETQQNSKVEPDVLRDYSVGAFLTDEENRTLWVNGMPYGNAYISFNASGIVNARQPRHAEVFNKFEKNKAEGHYSHAEGGAYVNTVYNNAKITQLETPKTIDGKDYSYSVPYTNVLNKMIGVMTSSAMNIPLYVVVNNENRLDRLDRIELPSDDETSNDIITDYDTKNTLLAIDKDGNPETFEYDGQDVKLENKVTSNEPTKYYIIGSNTISGNIYFNVATSFDSDPTELPTNCNGKTMYFHYYYAYDGKDGWSEATKDGAHAEGVSQACGVMSHAEGFANRSYEDYSHTEGVGNEVYGLAAHAEGDRNIVTNSAPYSHTEGHMNIAKADSVHVEGRNNLGNNTGAHVEGGRNVVNGIYGHAEGYGNTVNNDYGHAEGTYTVNNGKSSHTEGVGTITTNEGEHAEGRYNYTDYGSGFISTVGIGSSNDDRKNAIAIDNNGLIYVVNTTEVLDNNLTKFNPCMYDGLNLDKNTKSLQRILSEYTESLKNVTYAEIRSYIDNETLIPGKFYRIIDYCTTLDTKITHEYNIKSANNEFDIVVLALTNKTLSENAYAILRDTEISLNNQNIILENDNTITYSDNFNLNVYEYDDQNGYYTSNEQVKLTNYKTIKLEKPKTLEVKFTNDNDDEELLCNIDTNDIGNEILLVSDGNKNYIYNYPQIHNIINGLSLNSNGIIDNYNINSFISYDVLDLGNEFSITVNIESIDITILSQAKITNGQTCTNNIIYHFTNEGKYLECTGIKYDKTFWWGDKTDEKYLADYLADLSGVDNCAKVLGTYFSNSSFYMFSQLCKIKCKKENGNYKIDSIDYPSGDYNYFNINNSVNLINEKYTSIDNIFRGIQITASDSLINHEFNSKTLYFPTNTTTKTAIISFTSDDQKTIGDVTKTYKTDYSSTDNNCLLMLPNKPSIIFPEITNISGNIPSFLTKTNIENSINFYNNENPFNLQSWKLKYDINNTTLQTQASITDFYSYYDDDESVNLKNSLVYFNRNLLNIEGITNNFSNDVNTWYIVNNSSLILDLESFKDYRYVLNQIYPQNKKENANSQDVEENVNPQDTEETANSEKDLYSILTNNIYALSENDEMYKGILCISDKLKDLITPDEDNNDVFVTNNFKNAIFQANTVIHTPASFYTSLIDYYDEFGYAVNNKNWLIKTSDDQTINNSIKDTTCYLQTKTIKNKYNTESGESDLYLLYKYTEKNATEIDVLEYQINTDSTNLSYITYDNKQFFLLTTYTEDTNQYNIDLNTNQSDALEYKNNNVKNIVYEDSDGNKLKYYIYVALDKVNFENNDIITENITINDFTTSSLIDENNIFSSNIKLYGSYIIAAVVEDYANNNYDIYRHNGKPCIYRINKDKIYSSSFYTSFVNFPDFYIADNIFESSIASILRRKGLVEKWNVLYYDLESITYNYKQYNLSALNNTVSNDLFTYNIFTYNKLNYLDQIYTIYKNESETAFNLLSNWFNENEADTTIKTLLNTYNYFTNDLNIISFALFEEYSNFEGLKISKKYSPVHKYEFMKILEKIERPYQKIKYHLPFYFAKGNIYGFIDEYNNSFGYDPTNIKFLGKYNKYYYTFNVQSGSGNTAIEDNALRFGNIRNNRFSVLDINSNTGGIFDKIIINCDSTNLYAVNNDFSDIVSMQINAAAGIKINNSKFTNINTTVFENLSGNTINIENSIFSNLLNATMIADNYSGAILNNIDNSEEYAGNLYDFNTLELIKQSITPIFALSNFRIYPENTTTDIKKSKLYDESLAITKIDDTFTVTYSPATATSFNVKRTTSNNSFNDWNVMYNTSKIEYTIELPASTASYAYKLENKKYIKLGYLDCCTHYYYSWHKYSDARFAPDIHLKLKPTISVTGAYAGTYSFSYDTINVQDAKEKTTYDRTLSSLIALDVSLLDLKGDTSITEYNGNTYLQTTDAITVNITIPVDGYYCGAKNDAKTTGIDIKLSEVTFTPISETAPTVHASNINVVNVFNGNDNGRTFNTNNLTYNTSSATGTVTKYKYSTAGTDSLVAVCKDGVLIKSGKDKYVITTTSTDVNKTIINTDYFGKNNGEQSATSHIVP